MKRNSGVKRAYSGQAQGHQVLSEGVKVGSGLKAEGIGANGGEKKYQGFNKKGTKAIHQCRKGPLPIKGAAGRRNEGRKASSGQEAQHCHGRKKRIKQKEKEASDKKR